MNCPATARIADAISRSVSLIVPSYPIVTPAQRAGQSDHATAAGLPPAASGRWQRGSEEQTVAQPDTHSGEPAATCGNGLADQSTLPAKLGELAASVGRILEVHMTALDLTDPAARAEHDAYAEVAAAYYRIAETLAAVADQMAGHRDLPMGRHDPQAMIGEAARDAFGEYVEVKRELRGILDSAVALDQTMLDAYNGTSSGGR
jgi:hypothetical protein